MREDFREIDIIGLFEQCLDSKDDGLEMWSSDKVVFADDQVKNQLAVSSNED